METHTRGQRDEFDVVFINTNNNNNDMMVLVLLLLLRAATDKHSIRPGPKFEINSFRIYYILYRTLLRVVRGRVSIFFGRHINIVVLYCTGKSAFGNKTEQPRQCPSRFGSRAMHLNRNTRETSCTH